MSASDSGKNRHFASLVYMQQPGRPDLPTINVLVSEEMLAGRKHRSIVQLHDYLDLDRQCGSHFATVSLSIPFDFFGGSILSVYVWL